MPAAVVMCALYATTDPSMYKAVYNKRCLTVNFDIMSPEECQLPAAQQEILRQATWERLVPLLGRNCFTTQLERQGGDLLKLGAPKFKYMLLPREEVVVTVQFSELLSAGGSIEKFSNRGTAESNREFKRVLADSKFCTKCFRRVSLPPRGAAQPEQPEQPKFMPIHGCSCHQDLDSAV